jgi:hypothetical protein
MGKKGKTISGIIGIMPYFRVSYFSKNGHKYITTISFK